ncbi:Ba164 [Baboon cytomegalovirus]|nr:Ba164 [Baboon cytomegalovirus]
MSVRRAVAAVAVVLMSLASGARSTDIDHLSWDQCYEDNSPAPLIMPLGSQITIPCTFLPHSWPMVSIRARFCQSEYAGHELIVNVTNGTLVRDDLTGRLSNASWDFVNLGLAHYITLNLNVTNNATAMFDCVLRNDTHGRVTKRFTVITFVETLQRPGEPDCRPKLGFNSDGDRIWTSEHNEWQRQTCGTFYGFDRVFYYLAKTNHSNHNLPCPPSAPDRCWPVVQQYILDGDCFRIQIPRRRKIHPHLFPHDGQEDDDFIELPWVTLGLTVFLIGALCAALMLIIRMTCGKCCRSYERFQKKQHGYRPVSGLFVRPAEYDELYCSVDDDIDDMDNMDDDECSKSYEALFDCESPEPPYPDDHDDPPYPPPLYSEIKRRL